MATKSKKETRGSSGISARGEATSLAIAAKGIVTGQDFANCMSALMSDLISGKVPPQIGNAVCNAGGKLLKIVELQGKYGVQQTNGAKVLTLAMNQPLMPEEKQELSN